MTDYQNWVLLGTCVAPEGNFVYGLHASSYRAINLREEDYVFSLGAPRDGQAHKNSANFPAGDVQEDAADAVFEIANPFPFRGVTYIGKGWADAAAADPTRIVMASPVKVSLRQAVGKIVGADADKIRSLLAALPDPMRLALATTSTDPLDLKALAETACQFIFDPQTGRPVGLVHEADEKGRMRPRILNGRLFKAVANNPCLDDAYKEVMVLRPGIQGESEIVGEWKQPGSHVFEYLRRNSYIPWGHYAANMAHDCVRYDVADLATEDIHGMRHLYYQRSYVRLAQELGLPLPVKRRTLSDAVLEALRLGIVSKLDQKPFLAFTATLWGWNYGFDYAPSGFRLHASHQQIHQQFALVPNQVDVAGSDKHTAMPAYAAGDMVHAFVQQYGRRTGRSFFDCYEKAIRNHQRMDGRTTGSASLVVYEDRQVMLFVPIAQTSQWELQLMPKKAVGNILEADVAMRQSLDKALLVAMRVLTGLGGTMITVIEYSRRFDADDRDQRLLYVFLPRLPNSPGAFSEAQLRWINGHYPEDFALACRLQLEKELAHA